jgi:hypothetical protein
MPRSDSASALRSEFDEFLLAPIGEDRNGGLLSVLSALARMDIDPWEEAAKLAQLPVETAIRTLASLIAALPGGASARPDPEMIAPRLIALLPRQAATDVLPRKTLVAETAAHSYLVRYLICYLICMLIVLVSQWFMASVQPPARAAKAPTVASTTVQPQSPPPSPGE